MFGGYEIEGAVTRIYYSMAGQPIAVRDSGLGLSYLYGDHIGSVSASTNSSGVTQNRQTYDPWGKVISGSLPQTRRNFTGQYLDDTGLLFYNARYYDPGIGRFVSADSIVPSAGSLTVTPNDDVAAKAWAQVKAGVTKNPQELNRYTYVLDNPIKHTDPTGHECGEGADTKACSPEGGGVPISGSSGSTGGYGGGSAPEQLTTTSTSTTGQTPAEAAAAVPTTAGSNARGAAGQTALSEYYPGNPQSFQTTLGARNVDLVERQGNIYYAREAKNFKTPIRANMHVLQEALKDWELKQTFAQIGRRYIPEWHFFDAGPSKSLANTLKAFGIRIIRYK